MAFKAGHRIYSVAALGLGTEYVYSVAFMGGNRVYLVVIQDGDRIYAVAALGLGTEYIQKLL